MTIDEIVTLIQAVSDNGLTSFEYEEGDQKLVLKKKKKKNIAQAPVAPVVISQPAAPMMSPVPMPVAAAPLLQQLKPLRRLRKALLIRRVPEIRAELILIR